MNILIGVMGFEAACFAGAVLTGFAYTAAFLVGLWPSPPIASDEEFCWIGEVFEE